MGALYHPRRPVLPSNRQRLAIPFTCAAIAAVLTMLVAIPLLRPVGWNLSALPHVAGPATPMGRKALEIDPSFHVVSGGYDGQFYWGIAVDPLARGYVHQRFDNAPYRYGHPLLGWVGWAISLGKPRWVPAALFITCFLSMLAAAFVASRFAQERGRSGWEGLAIALNPGLLFAATHDLTEPLSAALLFGGLLAYARGRRVVAVVAFALLVLSKEQFALVPAGVALWELIRGARRLRTVALLAASGIPAVVWWIYARAQLGAWFTRGAWAIDTPFAGWKRTILDAGAWSYSSDYYQFLSGEATLVVVVSLLAVFAITAVRAARIRTPLEVVYLLLAALTVCLVWDATYILRDALRNVSIILALVPFVVFAPLRAPDNAAVSAEREARPEP
jgi:hypothetical protein